MIDIYHRLSDIYKVASIDRDLSDDKGNFIAERVIMIPAKEPYHQMGAAMLLAILAFPENANKRKKFVNYANAKLIKLNFPQNSQERKEYKKFTSIKNKQIEQFLGIGKKGAGYRLNARMRAADVLWRKLHSNSDPAKQESLSKIANEVAQFNSHAFPAFSSEDEEEMIESFIKRVIWPAKPVMHLAMGLYLQLHTLGIKDNSIISLINQSDKWLSETLFVSEMIRVEFGSLFPSHNSQYLKVRSKNITIELNQTIAFFPIIDAELNEQEVNNQLFF